MKAKKILSGFLALLMILTAVPLAFAAEDIPESGVIDKNISYTFDYETRKLSFYGEGKLNIPIYKEPWRTYLEIVQEVDIGEGITGITSYTFSFYRSMTTLKLPETLKNIGSDAFLSCSSLTSLIIPASCERISSHAFNGCTSLKELDIRDGLVEIEDFAFMNCSSLKEVTIPQSVRKIGNHSFFNSALEEITVLSYNISVNEHGLGYCEGVEGVDVKEYPLDVYVGPCTKNNDCVIKSFSNSYIEDYADKNGLRFEALDESYLRPCGKNAFYTFDEETATLTISGSGKMYDYDSDTLPEWRNLYENISYYNNYIRNLVVEEGITSIGKEAFENCVCLESVQLPSTLESIEDKAFSGCVSLETIVFPESLSLIGSMSFSDCCSLKEIVVPDNVEYVGDSIFSGCAMLEKVTLGKGVTKISEGMFEGCFSLKQIEYNSEIEEISADAFVFTLSLETIEIPETVKLIGENAFLNSLASDIIIYSDDVVLGQDSIGYVIADFEFLKDYLSFLIKYYNIEKQITIAKFTDKIEKANELKQELDVLEIELSEKYNVDEVFFEEAAPCPIAISGYENSTAHEYAKENGINHSIIGSTCDDACGVHNIYTNGIMEPTCTENGYKGGVVCLDCEKIFEAATIIPPKGHTETIQPGFAPTCTEPGCADTKVCAVCGDVLEDVRLIQPKGHTDNDNNGICDECGDEIEGYEPEEVPETIAQKIINFFKGIVDAILALFRKLFG